MAVGPYAHLLGRASVRVGSSSVDFLPNKRFQLLAYLAYQGDWVGRDKLAFLFWPDESNRTARMNLRQLLKNVRKMDWLEGLESDEHRLRWAVATDVGTFKQALEDGMVEDTLSLYRGPLLPGMEGSGEGEFSEWLAMEREAVHERWRETLLSKVQDLKVSERYDLATKLLSALLERDPLDEEALRAYMRAALKAGHREQALSTYRTFVKHLLAGLGMEPTSATEQLAKEIEKVLPPIPVPVIPTSETTAPSSPLPHNPRPPEVRPVPLLPKPATSFVGRDLELGQIVHLLAQEDCRMLTLTGAGGVGKTRLALQAAQELGKNYPDGVYVVLLDSLTSASAIPTSLASALGVELQGQDDPLTQVIHFLQNTCILIVLDNYEHLLGGAMIVSELLQGCPQVKVLVTSRERLNLEEEWLLPVEGLGYSAVTVSVEEASTYDAVRLFVQRVRRVQPSFTLTNEELPHVVGVCRLVDGSPLGIELAAAWVRSMPVADLASEIRRDYNFLQSASRNLRERHRSIRAVFEGSWRLLSPTEQEVLRKLTVFQGGFRKEAAAYVTGASYAVLTALVDKSLLRVSSDGRYDRHPLLHQYAREKLAACLDEEMVAKEKHARYYHALLLAKEGNVDQKHDLDDVDAELENIRGALMWPAVVPLNHFQRILETVMQFFDLRGRYREGEELFGLIAAQLDEAESAQRAPLGAALVHRAWLCFRLGDLDACRQFAEHGLSLVSFPTDCIPVILGWNTLASLAQNVGDYAEAKRLRELLTELIGEVVDKAYLPPHLAYRAQAANLGNAANCEVVMGNYEEAKRLYGAALALNRRIGHAAHAASVSASLGELLLRMDRPNEALPHLQEGLLLARTVGVQRVIPDALAGLAAFHLALGEHTKAENVAREALYAAREGKMPDSELEALLALAKVAARRGDHAEAERVLKDCLTAALALQEAPIVLAGLADLVELRIGQGRLEGAASLVGLVVGHPRTTYALRGQAQRALSKLEGRLPSPILAAALERGKAMTLEVAVRTCV